MVRHLAAPDYAMVSALIGLMTIVAVPAATAQTTTSHRVAQLAAVGDWQTVWATLRRRGVFGGLVAAGGFLAIVGIHPLIAAFLQFPNAPAVIVAWAAAVSLSILTPIIWGTLQGLQAFTALGINLMLNTGLKLGVSAILVRLGWSVFGAVYGIALATVCTLVVAGGQLRVALHGRSVSAPVSGPWWTRMAAWISDGLSECLVVARGSRGLPRYPLVVAFSVMAYTSLTNVDVVLVKHFFDPVIAGHYAVGAMVSRGVLFLPMAFSMVLFPKVAHAAAMGEDARPLLWGVLKATAVLSAVACGICLWWPAPLMGMLAGMVYWETIPVMRILAVAMAGMAVANLGLVYLLAVQRVRLIVPYLVGAVAQVALITVFHTASRDIAWITMGIAGALAAYTVSIASR